MSKVTSRKPKTPSDFTQNLILYSGISAARLSSKSPVYPTSVAKCVEMLIWQIEEERHRLPSNLKQGILKTHCGAGTAVDNCISVCIFSIAQQDGSQLLQPFFSCLTLTLST